MSVQLAMMQVADAIKGAGLLAEMLQEPQIPRERAEQNAAGAIAAILSLTALHTDNLLRFMRGELPDTYTILTPANAVDGPLVDCLDLALGDSAVKATRRKGRGRKGPLRRA